MYRTMTIILVLSGLLLATAAAAIETRTGYVMPTACSDRKGGSAEDHTTECALEKECVASGFGLWVEGHFQKFDPRGHELALEYFKQAHRESNHKVRVVGDFTGSTIQVESLEAIE